jgi:hypothetical protein
MYCPILPRFRFLVSDECSLSDQYRQTTCSNPTPSVAFDNMLFFFTVRAYAPTHPPSRSTTPLLPSKIAYSIHSELPSL